jgi:hypothetical protein
MIQLEREAAGVPAFAIGNFGKESKQEAGDSEDKPGNIG